MTDWGDLARELDLWRAAGRQPTFWWRDDDAVAASPALTELRCIAQAPVALAVIPAAPDRSLEDSLAPFLANWPLASVLQHGIGHRNHAPAGAKNSEFPAGRPLAEILLGLEEGLARLQNAFGPRFLPVLTPPWNRIADHLLPYLPPLGFCGLSRFSEPPFEAPNPVAGLCEINAQVDVIDWHGSRGFAGLDVVLPRLIGHLAARRTGRAAPDVPTGILTHHLVHDTATWRFLENLQDWLARQGAGGHLGGYFVATSTLWPPI